MLSPCATNAGSYGIVTARSGPKRLLYSTTRILGETQSIASSTQ